MQLYKTTYCLNHVCDDGQFKMAKPVWHSSEADAGKFRAATRKDFKSSNPLTTPVEFVPNKGGILALLNGPHCF